MLLVWDIGHDLSVYVCFEHWAGNYKDQGLGLWLEISWVGSWNSRHLHPMENNCIEFLENIHLRIISLWILQLMKAVDPFSDPTTLCNAGMLGIYNYHFERFVVVVDSSG